MSHGHAEGERGDSHFSWREYWGGQRTVFHSSLWRKRGCTGLQWLRARGRSEGLKVCGKELEHHLYGKARGTYAL